MVSSEKVKKIFIVLVVAYVIILFLSFIGGSILNVVSPPDDSHEYTSHYSSTYSSPTSSSHYSSSPSSSSHSHYSVRTDPYELARNDPGSYYDHYEYGDDYDIDDYLESEGYD